MLIILVSYYNGKLGLFEEGLLLFYGHYATGIAELFWSKK